MIVKGTLEVNNVLCPKCGKQTYRKFKNVNVNDPKTGAYLYQRTDMMLMCHNTECPYGKAGTEMHSPRVELEIDE